MKEARVMKFNRKKKDNEIITLKNDVAEMNQLLRKLVEDNHGR